MKTLLLKLGLLMIWRLIRGEQDSTELEEELATASNESEVEAIALREGEKAIAEVTGQTEAAIITQLITANSAEDVQAVVMDPAAQKSILHGLSKLVKMVCNFLTGR